jgi:hypothetical protein
MREMGRQTAPLADGQIALLLEIPSRIAADIKAAPWQKWAVTW